MITFTSLLLNYCVLTRFNFLRPNQILALLQTFHFKIKKLKRAFDQFMIITKICGGLGNQLFQYAAGRSLAHNRGVELLLDLSWFEHRPSSNTAREFELCRYEIQARKPKGREKLWLKLHQGRFLSRMPLLPRRWRHFREKAFAFDPRILELPDNTYLDGYWQSYKYFSDIAQQIRTELTPKAVLGDMDQAVAKEISHANCQAVSLHVRRGDYVTNPAAAKTHGLCGISYYEDAVRKVASILADPHFFVFSDDMEWVRNNLALPGKVSYVEHNGAERAFQDLRLMSLCDHHIVANSSFSWWGAWLRNNEDGLVIVPTEWFADDRNTQDLTPKHWVRI